MRVSSCSHTRNTRHPARRSVRVTSASRVLFADNLRRQNARLLAGMFECSGQPCQKQPSTKIAARCFGKTKSGLTRKVGRRCCAALIFGPRGNAALPRISECLLHPLMPCSRSNFTNASSVSLFPRPRIRDITSERFALVKTSGIEPILQGTLKYEPQAFFGNFIQ